MPDRPVHSDRLASGGIVRRLVPLVVIAAMAAALPAAGGQRYLSFAALAAHRAWLKNLVARLGSGRTAP